MERKWLWVVLVVFLLGGWCECEGCWDQEKTALLQLKPFFTRIDDSVEGKLSSNCCEWERVECNTSTGRVIRLFLNLTTTEIFSTSDLAYIADGTNYIAEYQGELHSIESERGYWFLNASLFLPFEKLKSLYLSGNSIIGCVDSQGFERLSLKLDKLEILDLSNNDFNDSILASLSELSSLKSLYLANNQLTGSNPTNGIMRLSKLNKLETLDLGGNKLGNNILSHLHGFTYLKSLRLQSCGLKGTVDMLEFNNLINLKKLYLGGNKIESLGSLFQSKGQLRLTKLEVLGLSRNLFNNSILSSLAALSDLKYLYIESNDLKGPIDIKELNALSNLVELYMSDNGVTDFVPSQDNENELKLMNLEVLDLRRNFFNNSILSFLNELSNLKSLYLGGDNFEGPIDLGGLHASSNLEDLYLGCYSSRACSLPLQSLDFFPFLKTLSLSGFNFYETWTIQNNETGQSLMKLEALDLIGNFKNNSILYSFLGRLSNLKLLVVRCQNLEGLLDLTACSLPLQSLDLLPSLKTLYLDGFSFNGAWTTQNNETGQRLMKLEVLDLTGNFKNSSILYSSLGRFSNLKSLSLRCSNLEESIDLTASSFPLQSQGLFPLLKTLSLSGFSFYGTLTTQNNETGQKLKNLELLELRGILKNSSGLSSLGRLLNLKSLSLTCQNLEESTNLGVVSFAACSLPLQSLDLFPSLKTLDLDGFSFTGTWTTQSSLHLKNLESLIILNSNLENSFVGAMPSLKSLEFRYCGLNDTLFTQGFCELKNLQELDIRDNNLKGNLSECFSHLTSLESLDLSSNQFSENISVLKSLTSLKSLDLSSNQFSGNISALKSLTSLKSLDLSNNNFEIPSSLVPLFNLSNLWYFHAVNNIIYTETEMHSLAPTFQLKEIRLYCCGDAGQFPQFLYHQHNLEYVYLSNIKLIGEFPNWLLENNSNLAVLFLANNSLRGHFELTFHLHESLSNLDISKNSFYGNIPNEIGSKLPSLSYLNMSENHFGSSIPGSIGDINSLVMLDLSNNNLTGGVPEHLAMGCSSLRVLILSNNNLQGQMFSSKFNLVNLAELKLDGNNFSGRIPDYLCNCSFLSTLDLSNNKLFGGIPRWMGNMSSLEEIIMANNHLEGPIPMEFCQLNHNHGLLDLSANNLLGSLPSCFSPSWIRQVHLSRNKLQGPLKNAFHNSTHLETLDLSYNHLNGSIPNWIDKLSQLSCLLLNNNHFEGGIPNQLCKLGHLSLIDLSNNNLSGKIPPCLKITILNDISQTYVHEKEFQMSLQETFFQTFFTEEQIMFTWKSNSYPYKGRVYLSGIDLSCNKLSGEIPHEVKKFQNIEVLNLSHNNLTGPIPLAISDLRQIESLDLSHNKLSGKIPSQLVGLNYLSYFTVAYNNLSGSTPKRIAQFATFEENSYLGNRFLCGTPLPNNCSIDGPSPPLMPKASSDNGSIDMNVFRVSFVVSYIMVLLSIASVLYINPYWRRAWFYHIEAGITSCYYFVLDNILPKRFNYGNI